MENKNKYKQLWDTSAGIQTDTGLLESQEDFINYTKAVWEKAQEELKTEVFKLIGKKVKYSKRHIEEMDCVDITKKVLGEVIDTCITKGLGYTLVLLTEDNLIKLVKGSDCEVLKE